VKQFLVAVVALGLAMFVLKTILSSPEPAGLPSETATAVAERSDDWSDPTTSASERMPVLDSSGPVEAVTRHDPTEPDTAARPESAGTCSIRARVTLEGEPSASLHVTVSARDEKGTDVSANTGK
jgi:hypothetical protein